MKEHDFDAEQEPYDDDMASDEIDEAFGFNNVPNPTQEEHTPEPIEVQEPEAYKTAAKSIKPKGKLQIDIDDVYDLMSQLSFSSQELVLAVEKVEKNKDISQILRILSDLKTSDISKIENIYASIEKNIDAKKIENVVIKQIELSTKGLKKDFEKSKKEIEQSTSSTVKKFQAFADAFEDEELFQTVEDIQKIESFTKKFSFKSAVAASLISAIVTSIATYNGFEAYFTLQSETKIKELTAKYQNLGNIMKSKKFTTYQDLKTEQIVFTDYTKLKCFTTNEGKNVIQFNLKKGK